MAALVSYKETQACATLEVYRYIRNAEQWTWIDSVAPSDLRLRLQQRPPVNQSRPLRSTEGFESSDRISLSVRIYVDTVLRMPICIHREAKILYANRDLSRCTEYSVQTISRHIIK